MSRVFYFDEIMSHQSAYSMHHREQALTGFTVTTILDEFGGTGTPDEDIAERLQSKTHKTIIVTQDDDFAKRELFASIMKSSNMGLFLIKFPRGSKLWRQHVFMVNHWEKIKEKSTRFPFAYVVKFKNKFEKL